MATDQAIQVFPGDVVQDSQGQLYLAAETHKWGVGAVQRWRDGDEVREAYFRLKPGQFVVVGATHLLPEEVAQARRDAIALARELARERGTTFFLDPLEAVRDIVGSADDPVALARSVERILVYAAELEL